MEIFSQLRKSLVIPVVRVDDEPQAVAVTEVLVEAGMTAIEITMTVKGAVQAIAKLSTRYPSDILIGAGTVLTVQEAEAVFRAGARFAVAPSLSTDVVEFCGDMKMPFIPGVLTPTEILAARNIGCRIVKIFPASSAGGPAYIRTMKSLFTDMDFMPTGGVGLENMREYIDAGAAIIGSGGELVDRTLVRANRYREIGERAEKFLETARRART